MNSNKDHSEIVVNRRGDPTCSPVAAIVNAVKNTWELLDRENSISFEIKLKNNGKEKSFKMVDKNVDDWFIESTSQSLDILNGLGRAFSKHKDNVSNRRRK
jgi:hypothetical protein